MSLDRIQVSNAAVLVDRHDERKNNEIICKIFCSLF
jgi:hypothetical protein